MRKEEKKKRIKVVFRQTKKINKKVTQKPKKICVSFQATVTAVTYRTPNFHDGSVQQN